MKKKPLKTITIAQWAQVHTLYLPLYVAMERGHFAREGLEVDLRLVGNDDDIYEHVATGKTQFGLGDPTFCSMLPKNKRKGVKARTIATVASRVGIWGITHSPVIRPVKNLSDLVGLRVGCFPRPSTTYALINELKNSNKRLLRSMQIIESPIGQQTDLLLRDEADIALTIEPFVSIGESRGYQVVYSFADLHGLYSFSALFGGTDVLENDPELAKKVVRAIAQALKDLRTGIDAGLEVSRKLFPELKDTVLRNSVKRCLKADVWPETPFIDKKSWEKAIKTRMSVGDKFIPDIYAGMTNEFIE